MKAGGGLEPLNAIKHRGVGLVKAVNRLLRIADDHQFCRLDRLRRIFPRQASNQVPVQVIGVLKLIDEDEANVSGQPSGLVAAEQLDGPSRQVIEIELIFILAQIAKMLVRDREQLNQLSDEFGIVGDRGEIPIGQQWLPVLLKFVQLGALGHTLDGEALRFGFALLGHERRALIGQNRDAGRV